MKTLETNNFLVDSLHQIRPWPTCIKHRTTAPARFMSTAITLAEYNDRSNVNTHVGFVKLKLATVKCSLVTSVPYLPAAITATATPRTDSWIATTNYRTTNKIPQFQQSPTPKIPLSSFQQAPISIIIFPLFQPPPTSTTPISPFQLAPLNHNSTPLAFNYVHKAVRNAFPELIKFSKTSEKGWPFHFHAFSDVCDAIKSNDN